MSTDPYSASVDQQFSDLLRDAVQRVLHGEPLEPFTDWFASTLDALAGAPSHAGPQGNEARRQGRYVARMLWSQLPVPAHRWRPRPLPKTERNAPCHCGSGRKFKQCCAEFDGMPLPFISADSLTALALAHAEPGMLGPDQVRLVPPEALGHAAQSWNDEGEPERTVDVLEPMFLARDDLDQRHEFAFDVLMDALLTLGLQTRREVLVRRVAQSHDKALATAARCRHVSMLADRGEFDAAWQLFAATQKFNPGDSQLWHLELTLLLAQNRPDEARLRAPLLAARARKAGYADMAQLLVEMGEGGLSVVRGAPDEDGLEEFTDMAWIALCESAPSSMAPQDWQACHTLAHEAGDGDGPSARAFLVPGKKILALQKRWRKKFPVEKPQLTSLLGDAQGLFDELEGATEFLRANPLAWLSLEVLDDLLLAGTELCAGNAPRAVLAATQRLADHALAGLRALLAAEAGAAPFFLDWADQANRPPLRLLAQCIELARERHDLKAQEALAQWALALNPHDNHGWRGLLVPLYLNQSRFAEALGLLDRYPSDFPPAEHHRALALFAMGRPEEAEEVLRRSHADYPAILDALLPDVLDAPPDEGGFGIPVGGAIAAFENRAETRGAWVGSGALAWARALQLPAPAPKAAKARKKSAAPRKSAPPAAAKPRTQPGGYGVAQENRLRKAFGDYPRLHGLLTAVAWSPQLLMQNQWLSLVLGLHRAPPDQALPAKGMDADLNAMLALYNHLVGQLEDPAASASQLPASLLAATAAEGGAGPLHWAAGFVQGAELAAGAWRSAGRPLKGAKGSAFGELQTLAAQAGEAGQPWQASRDDGQPLLVGLDAGSESNEERLRLALADLWHVVLPLRRARAGGR